MTLSSATNRNNYTANGSNDTFAYQFRVDDSDHLKVYLDDVLQSSGYSVTGVGNDNGGNAVFTSPPDNGVAVTLLREVPLTQPTDIPTQGPLNSSALEQQLDQLVMQIQQVRELIARSVVLPVSSSLSELALPTPVANNLLGWNTAADALQNYSGAADSAVSSAMAAVVAAATLALGREELGVEIGADVQAYSAKLAAIAALAVTDGGIIVGDGATFTLESGATARTSLGLAVAAGAFTRDMTAASGNQAVTGVGFQPTVVFVNALVDGVDARTSWGFAVGTTEFAVADRATGSANGAGVIAQLGEGGTSQAATLVSMDADGFTLGWTKAGSPTGTANGHYLAIRI